MSDRRLRELERRWRESGAPEDRAFYFNELVRVTGKLEESQRAVYGIAETDVALIKNVESRAVHVGSPLLVQLHNPRRRVPQTICRVLFRPVETDDVGDKHGYMFRMGSPDEVTCRTCKSRIRKVLKAKEVTTTFGVTQLRMNERPANEAIGCTDHASIRRVWSFTPWGCTQGTHLWERRPVSNLWVCRGCGATDRPADYASARNPITAEDERLTEWEKP